MAILNNNPLIGASGQSTGYRIERSLRFNRADTAYLDRTPAFYGNQKTWTISFWVKRTGLSTTQTIFNAAGNGFLLQFQSDNTIQVYNYSSFAYQLRLITTQVFRDVSSWYHVVFALDTTQSTSSNRAKLYINGTHVTAFSTSIYPSQNADMLANDPSLHVLGNVDGFSQYLDAYLAEVHFVGGSALDPSSFGETDTDTGVWKPKRYSGSYGTNGFKLTFSDNSNTTAATLGKDSSGNGNNWTPNNFSVTAGAGNDSLVDTPTPYGTDTGAGGSVRGNYATLNPLQTGIDLSNGNLNFTNGAANESSYSTIGVSSGKWFCEAIFTSYTSTSILGIAREGSTTTSSFIGSNSGSYGWDANGNKYNNGSGSAYGSARSANDVIGCALDLDAGTVTFYLNGVSQGTAYSSLPAGTYFFGISSNSSTGNINFGQRPFAYTAPSGFKALCTTNLPTPTIGATSSTRANKYFNPVLYSGAGTQAITGVGFQPDIVWLKSRSNADGWAQCDAVRGADKLLQSNNTNAESTTASVSAFSSDGFTVDNNWSTSGRTYVSYSWKANGAGVTNTAGSITSTVSANTTAGFSIVNASMAPSGSNSSVGHGLGTKPAMVIVKNRDAVDNWFVWHQSLASQTDSYLFLNTTAAAGSFSNIWGTGMTSTVIGIRPSSFVATTQNVIFYAFAPVAGYSAFGSYTGNGADDGPFNYLGFRAAFILIKRSSAAGEGWWIYDNKRSPYNIANVILSPDSSGAEISGGTYPIDINSNGFKNRGINALLNTNGATYIYAAFAEVPQKFSLAR